MEHLYRKMSTVDGLQLYGPPPPSASTSSRLDLGRRAALCAFNVEGIHPTDISSFLDQQVGGRRRLTLDLSMGRVREAGAGVSFWCLPRLVLARSNR